MLRVVLVLIAKPQNLCSSCMIERKAFEKIGKKIYKQNPKIKIIKNKNKKKTIAQLTQKNKRLDKNAKISAH